MNLGLGGDALGSFRPQPSFRKTLFKRSKEIRAFWKIEYKKRLFQLLIHHFYL